MTPESPINPRQALEASLTALILGELPDDQAEFLLRTIAEDLELSKQYERLKNTIELVRETEVTPAKETMAQPASLKLSDKRREKLLEHFKTVAPKEFSRPPRRTMQWLIPVAAAVAVIAVLASALLPSLSRAKFESAGFGLRHRGYAQFAAKDSGGRDLEELRRQALGVRGPEPGLAPAPNEQPAPTISWGIANKPLIVLPSGGKPEVISAGDNQNAMPNPGWAFSANSKGFYDDSSAQSPPSGSVDASTKGESDLVRPGGVPISNQVLNDRTLSGGGGGLAGGTITKGDLPLAYQDVNKLGDQKQGNVGLADGSVRHRQVLIESRPQEALRNSGDSGGNAFIPSGHSFSPDGRRGGAAQQANEPATPAGLAPDHFWAETSANRDRGDLGLPKTEQRPRGVDSNTGLPLALATLNYESKEAAAAPEKAPRAMPPVSFDLGTESAPPNESGSARTPSSVDTPNLGGERKPEGSPSIALTGITSIRDKQQIRQLVKLAESKSPESELEQKRRQLDELEKSRSLFYAELAKEGKDTQLPQNEMVQIVEPAKAETDERLGLLGEIRHMKLNGTGEVERKARIKVERDQSDLRGTSRGVDSGVYDPYFVQTEFESIQSDAVLGKVAEKLNLNEAWAKKKGTDKLKSEETLALLKDRLDLRAVPNSSVVEIGVKSDKPEEAAKIANAIAEVYQSHRREQQLALNERASKALEGRLAEQESRIAQVKQDLEGLQKATNGLAVDSPLPKPATAAPIPQPEVQTRDNAFSTFSLNVSDVSFKLAAASLEKGLLPEAASIRAEEFINAFDYRDPEPAAGVPVGFAWERARYPFAQNRDLLRFSLKTAAQGRQAGRPLNIVLLLDNSGSMERADRVSIIREALRVLAAQLQPQDTLSVVLFARTARLWADGVPGSQAAQVVEQVSGLTPEGGTNLEEAMNLAYQTALRHYQPSGINRVVLLTDGAANLGNVDPETLKKKVEANRKQGIALDCFGIGWEGYNDDLLEVLARNSDGRYGFINTPEEAATEFVGQLAGALQVAAADVKVQVEFNPTRVTAYRQIGYAKHQLTKEQFRDNTVDAAELGAAESGNALYVIETNPSGVGPLATVRVRYRVPGTSDYREHEWAVPYTGNALLLEQSSPAMRLAATAGAFAEWLASSPFAAEVTPDALVACLNGVPDVYGADQRPKKLEWMLRQAKSITGK